MNNLVESKIRVRPVETSRIHEVDMNHIPFGREFTDHMLVAHFREGQWQQPEIIPYGKLQIAPAVTALNYGQSIFEGMKAFKSPAGDPLLFRPEANFQRMNQSAHRMCMPEIPASIFMDGLNELLRMERQWIPHPDQGSLYIRPLYFGADEYIGVRASDTYTFTIFMCPVGPYYNEPVKLLVSRDFIRAAAGGTGSAKTAGNYAASLLPDKIAKSQGYHNVLWLDARELKYVEECGTMNIFFVIDDLVITPSLTGTILAGITRNSVIQLLKDNGYKLEVRPVSIYEIQSAYREGRLKEAFGAGTAATISHISTIGFAGEDMKLPAIEKRAIGNWLHKTMSDMKNGLIDDPYGWIIKV